MYRQQLHHRFIVLSVFFFKLREIYISNFFHIREVEYEEKAFRNS